MALRPLIGLTSYWRRASWGHWTDVPVAFLPQAYPESVAAAGGTPVLVPPLPELEHDPGAVLDGLHGLVLTGGEDIDPTVYGADRHPETDPAGERDLFELALLREALARDLPVLGICRGIQILNVAYGGLLVQNLGDELDGELHLPRPGLFGRHHVEVTGGRLRELVGDRVPVVWSHHHQGISTIGEGLVQTAVGPDGIVEALEDPERAFCVAVLWHPEEDGHESGAPLFRGLVESAQGYAAR